MRRALLLAEKGRGSVSPNPMVGALLLRDDQCLAEGFHGVFGGPHAEVVCLNQLPQQDLRDTILLVTLEPCSHTGKTPPCTDLILERKIPHVIVAMEDPNPLVAGRGIKRLREGGVRVDVGLLEPLARRLNRGFIKQMEAGRPWVTLKWAASLDGRISLQEGRPTPISSPASRQELMRLRKSFDGILVGIGTALADNPRLTVPDDLPRSPQRFIVDPLGQLPPACRLQDSLPTIPVHIIVSSGAAPERLDALRQAGYDVHILKSSHQGGGGASENLGSELSVASILACVKACGVNSLLVEGGAQVHGRFIASGDVDELIQISSPQVFGSGTPAVHLALKEGVEPHAIGRFQSLSRRIIGSDEWRVWAGEL
jgi:diaminohydroxyphosphoribosylaminopyrimidine deaminase / 5-amino-6-(5-phosphoribosylamino)uracil reductase